MNTKFKVIGLTRLEIKPKSTATKADARTTRPPELFMPAVPTSLHLSSLLKTKKQCDGCNCFLLQTKSSRGSIFVNAGLKTVSMLLMQERCFAVNVEHADSHRHTRRDKRPECDYYLAMFPLIFCSLCALKLWRVRTF